MSSISVKRGWVVLATAVAFAGCATTKQTVPPPSVPTPAAEERPETAPPAELPQKVEGKIEEPAPPEPPTPVELATAEEAFAAGKKALEAKDPTAAVHALQRCVELAPENLECRWELGWAHWLASDWAKVVAAWELVKEQAPEHPELEERLAQARVNLERQRKLAMEAGPRAKPPADATVRIRAVGDVMIGSDFPNDEKMPPEDGATALAGVKALLEDADLTFINLEGPLCDGGETNKCRKSGNCYAFRSPTRFGKYFKEVGVDLASTANNHSGDFGEECRRQTERTLDALGIAWSGPPGSVATTFSNGVKVGMVAFHTSAACNYLNDHASAQDLVKAAKAAHDLVVVSFHGGAEGAKALHVPEGRETFFGENRGDLRKFSRAVIDAGADVVIGHGPHVVRGLEFYKGKLIAYSLGNFATYGQFNLRGPQALGAVLEVTLGAGGEFIDGRIFPTVQEGLGIPRPDEEKRALTLLQELTAEDFPGTGATLDDTGRISAPKATR